MQSYARIEVETTNEQLIGIYTVYIKAVSNKNIMQHETASFKLMIEVLDEECTLKYPEMNTEELFITFYLFKDEPIIKTFSTQQIDY